MIARSESSDFGIEEPTMHPTRTAPIIASLALTVLSPALRAAEPAVAEIPDPVPAIAEVPVMMRLAQLQATAVQLNRRTGVVTSVPGVRQQVDPNDNVERVLL